MCIRDRRRLKQALNSIALTFIESVIHTHFSLTTNLGVNLINPYTINFRNL